jgi:hypothetical protein
MVADHGASNDTNGKFCSGSSGPCRILHACCWKGTVMAKKGVMVMATRVVGYKKGDNDGNSNNVGNGDGKMVACVQQQQGQWLLRRQ